MRFRKLISYLIICFLVLSTLLFSPNLTAVNSNALTTAQMKQKIQQYEKELKNIESQISSLKKDKTKYNELQKSLQQKINNLQKQIDLINNQLSTLNKEIEDNQKLIEQKTAELESTKDLLKKRLKAIYIAGSYNELQILLGANSFSDFLSRAELMRGVTKHDTSLMEKLNDEIKVINNKKKEIEQKKSETQQLKKSLVTKQNDLDRQYAAAKSNLQKISSSQSSLQARANKIDQEKRAMEKQWKEAIERESDPNRKFSGQFAWPFQSSYYISCPYGGYPGHKGVDISCSGAYGKPIYAAADGKVILAKYSSYGYGNHLIIDHGQINSKQYSTLYAHCSQLLVSHGQEVKKGQLIARVGSTGNSTGPHLHFEIRVNGVAHNPLNYYRNY